MTTVNLTKKRINKRMGGHLEADNETRHEVVQPTLTQLSDAPFNQEGGFVGDNHHVPKEPNWVKSRIQPGIRSINDWSAMQKSIRAYPARAKIRMKEIERQFTIYRLTYATILYKAIKVEEDIFGVYTNILDNIPRLEQRTRKRPLFLYTNTKLRELLQAWDNLSSLQDALSRMLERGPRKLDFYNRMLIYRDEKRRVAIQRRQNETRITAAYESIKKAMNFVERQTVDIGPVVFGNEILTLEDARNVWDKAISEILKQRETHSATTESIVGRMRALEESIRDFPSLSKQIQRIGERFTRIISYHDLLVSTGKRVIPQPEIARASVMMYEQVPEQWMTGNFQELKITLERVENFLNFYENTVELEIAVGERRRVGFNQNLPQPVMPGVSGLSPLIGLARVLVTAIDQRDRFMVGHSAKVAELVVATGRKLNWSVADLEFLEIAALLHDIGKISIPESVLTKVKPLTDDEWKTIQMHPFYGAQIVKQINLFNHIVPWIYHHQEHWDGTGYPEQLSKQEIPQASSIIGIAEAFTVMTAELPYHQAVNQEEAVDLIKQDSGKQFDPEMVEAFSEMIAESPDEDESSSKTAFFEE